MLFGPDETADTSMQKILTPLTNNPYIPSPFAKRPSLSEVIDKLPPRPKRRNVGSSGLAHTPSFAKAKTIKFEKATVRFAAEEEVKEFRQSDTVADSPGLPLAPVNLKAAKRPASRSRVPRSPSRTITIDSALNKTTGFHQRR